MRLVPMQSSLSSAHAARAARVGLLAIALGAAVVFWHVARAVDPYPYGEPAPTQPGSTALLIAGAVLCVAGFASLVPLWRWIRTFHLTWTCVGVLVWSVLAGIGLYANWSLGGGQDIGGGLWLFAVPFTVHTVLSAVLLPQSVARGRRPSEHLLADVIGTVGSWGLIVLLVP